MQNVERLIREAAELAKKSTLELEGLDLAADEVFVPEDLEWDRTTLIDHAATMLWDQLGTVLGGSAVVDRVWLERMVAQKVTARHMEEGYLDWALLVGLPGNNVMKSVSLTYPVRNGKLEAAKYFRISTGGVIPLTKETLLNYITIGKRPGW